MKVAWDHGFDISLQRVSSVAVLTAVELQECVQVREPKIPYSKRSGRDLHATRSKSAAFRLCKESSALSK